MPLSNDVGHAVRQQGERLGKVAPAGADLPAGLPGPRTAGVAGVPVPDELAGSRDAVDDPVSGREELLVVPPAAAADFLRPLPRLRAAGIAEVLVPEQLAVGGDGVDDAV